MAKKDTDVDVEELDDLDDDDIDLDDVDIDDADIDEEDLEADLEDDLDDDLEDDVDFDDDALGDGEFDADDDDDDDDDDDADEDEETTEALEELETQELQLLDEEKDENLLVDEVEVLRTIRREELTMNVEEQSQRPDEFVCQSCFMVKRVSQLANKRKQLCADCAE